MRVHGPTRFVVFTMLCVALALAGCESEGGSGDSISPPPDTLGRGAVEDVGPSDEPDATDELGEDAADEPTEDAADEPADVPEATEDVADEPTDDVVDPPVDATSPVILSVEPEEVTLGASGVQQFDALVDGAAPAFGEVEWLVDDVVGGGGESGTISAAGLYTAPDPASAADVTILARLVAYPEVFAEATVHLTDEEGAVSITTLEPKVPVGGAYAFGASTTGGIDPASLRWSIDPAVGRLDDLTGSYVAPAKLPDPAVPSIVVTVGVPGTGPSASTTLTLQELTFEPREITLDEPGLTAAFDIREALSDGTEHSVLGDPDLTLDLENPADPVAALGDGLLEALDPIGVAKLIVEDAATGANAGLRFLNVGKPTLYVDEDKPARGHPRVLEAAARRAARPAHSHPRPRSSANQPPPRSTSPISLS